MRRERIAQELGVNPQHGEGLHRGRLAGRRSAVVAIEGALDGLEDSLKRGAKTALITNSPLSTCVNISSVSSTAGSGGRHQPRCARCRVVVAGGSGGQLNFGGIPLLLEPPGAPLAPLLLLAV